MSTITRIHVPSHNCKIELAANLCRANTSMYKETRSFDWPEELVDDALSALLRSKYTPEQMKEDIVQSIAERHLELPETEHCVWFIVDDLYVNLYSRDGYWRIGGHWPYELERSNNMCIAFTNFLVSLANVERQYHRQEPYNVRRI